MKTQRIELPSDFRPTDMVPVIRLNPESGKRELVQLRWGLIPSWADDPSIGRRLIHARAETVATKRAFRDAFRHRRCMVVADTFHLRRQAIQMKDGQPFGMGGIWDRWQRDDEQIESCAVITTAANELVRPVNDRMPVIIAPEDYDKWLDSEFQNAEELQRMLEPFPADKMVLA